MKLILIKQNKQQLLEVYNSISVMKHCSGAIRCVNLLFLMRLSVYSYDIFSKNATIAHPETGLFFDYLGLYTPSETIIHTSAIFPMTTTTCHFLPLSAAKNIPSCNITTKRRKRFIDVISLGVGSASLAMSVSNTIQIGNLQNQVALVENSLAKVSQIAEIQGAQLAKLSLTHIEVIDQLQETQKAMNNLIPVLDKHSAAINALKTSLDRVQVRLQHSFLYLAITQIFRNELNLNFLLPEDIHKVVYSVIKQGNLTFNSYSGSLPIVQIITKLLVRQQIDFIPSSLYMTDDSEDIDYLEDIGRLVITSYFAVPSQTQTPFYIYKLVTIPFFYNNETIELARIPQYWAINLADNTTMQWHSIGESGCDFQLMTSCRDTPPMRTISKDNCLDQIIEKLPLSNCDTTSVSTEKYFIRQLKDNLWITSSAKSMHCLKIPRTEYLNGMQQTWSLNEELILPPVALINVTEGHKVTCPGFTLVGRPVTPNASTLVILHKNDQVTKNISVMNVHQYIIENITWFKKNVAARERENFMDFMRQMNAVSTYRTTPSTYMPTFGMLSSGYVLFGLSAALFFYFYRRKRDH